MRQITSGEIHNNKKNKVLDREKFKNFLNDQKNIFSNLSRSCLYSSLDFIKSNSINYLNFIDSKEEYASLKSIIIYEYNYLEKMYPYLGDLFLSLLFENKILNKKTKIKFFNEKLSKNLIHNFDYDINKELFKVIFDNFSLEYFVDIKFEKNIENPIIIKNNENNFNLEFEKDYYTSQKELVVTDYKVVILDGIIQYVSEIHHLLHDSAENKNSYLIFCYGTSEEVKHNIIENNKRGITKIYPICFNFDEYSLNVLNDIAVLHNSDIITSNKGQTISTEIRNLKKIGKKIKITNNNFSFKPVCSKEQLESHRNFINKRIEETNIEDNKKFLLNRYKRLFSKNMKIILPDQLKKDSDLNRELQYGLKLLSFSSHPVVSVNKINHKKNIFFPLHFLKIVNNKKESLKKMLKDIEKIIIQKR